jgi:hypothetical protein
MGQEAERCVRRATRRGGGANRLNGILTREVHQGYPPEASLRLKMLRLTLVALRLRGTPGCRPMGTVGVPECPRCRQHMPTRHLCSKVEHAIQAAMARRNAGCGATSSCLQCVLTCPLERFAICDIVIASEQCSVFSSCGRTTERHSIASNAILSLGIRISHAPRHTVHLR